MQYKTCNVVSGCFSRTENTHRHQSATFRAAELPRMQSSGKANTSPPTARVWVNATWSPDGLAKKRTLSLNAAERGRLVLNFILHRCPHMSMLSYSTREDAQGQPVLTDKHS